VLHKVCDLLIINDVQLILFPDELLLVERQQPPCKEPFRAHNVRGPTAEEIRVATKDVEERKPLKLLPPLDSNVDVSGTLGISQCAQMDRQARKL
jgi:hypothetical protein